MVAIRVLGERATTSASGSKTKSSKKLNENLESKKKTKLLRKNLPSILRKNETTKRKRERGGGERRGRKTWVSRLVSLLLDLV